MTSDDIHARGRFERWARLNRHRLQRDRGDDAWRVACPLLLDNDDEPLRHVAWVPCTGLDVIVAAADTAGLEAAMASVAANEAAAPQRELTRHLQALLERARTEGADARERRELLARMRPGDDDAPRSLASIRALIDEAWSRWRAGLEDRLRIRSLSTELHLSGYPELFHAARGMRRRFTLLVGPPNSGKTHGAIDRLAQAASGCYLAPLRLLALEGQEAIAARGVPASLVTGEERDLVPGARHLAATVEMLDTERPVDVAVIDEFQMIFDRDRGWAWTQAIAGAPAAEVLLVGAEHALPMVCRLLELLGESWTVQRFARKAPLDLDRERLVEPERLKAGDALIAFSRREVLRHKERLERLGRQVAVVYGALSPEVRRREAERFRSGEAQVLVATDAIGMGLNLPIARVVFSTLVKWDGSDERLLTPAEFHQIAGRAGRFGMHERGRLALLAGARPGWGALERLHAQPPAAPEHVRLAVAPAWRHVERMAEALGTEDLALLLGVFVERLSVSDTLFEPAPLSEMRTLAADVLPRRGLSLRERFAYAQAPAPERPESIRLALAAWARLHARGETVPLPELDGGLRSPPRTPALLQEAETALRTVSLYAWLGWRFPEIYVDLDRAAGQRRWLDGWIERALRLRDHREPGARRSGSPVRRRVAGRW